MTQGTFREALAVGCDLYDEDCYPNLKGAIRDAIKVHGFFSHAMPAGSRFDRVELMQNPTADQVVQRLREVQKRLGVGSLFVFYFAGHGIYRGNDNYLLCSNALESLSRPDGRGEFGAIPVSFMEDFYRRCQADIVSIYDACRSFVRKSARGAGESGDFGGATGFRNATDARPEAVGDVGARWTLMSCREGQKASDDGRFVDAWLGSMRARLDAGLELRLNDALVDDVYTKLGRGEQQPEPKGLGVVLAPGRPAIAQTQGVNDALLRRLEELEKRLAERETPAPPTISQTPASPKVETLAPKAGAPLELMIKGVKVVFRYCPAGTFMMGNSDSEEERSYYELQHEVRLTKGYWLLETPVTQALWNAVMGENPSGFKGEDLPVEYVSWNDCFDFVKKLNDGGYAPKGMKFDFPTEAEWEYACRAGSTTRYSFGNEITEADANYAGGNIHKTTPVKKYPPNAWNLWDMHGNVLEWVYDWYGGYPGGSVTDPKGPTSGSNRVQRGGSWGSGAFRCQSASRCIYDSSRRHHCHGFRVALRSADFNLCEESQKYSGSTNNNQPIDLRSTSQIVTSSASAAGSPLEAVIKGVKSVFRYCPAGTFIMGSPSLEEGRRDDEVQHEVRLTKGFWLLETPVTQALWEAVTGENPSGFKGKDLPVESVSWNDCFDFVSKLNDGGFAPKGMKFDFPTEAEWEYACRAGSTTRYSFGNEISASKANYNGNIGKTTPVKKYPPNAWNLWDMHGNVCEWVYDWDGDYPTGSVTDPTGPTSGWYRVLRGGSWDDYAEYCRSASRDYSDPSYRNSNYGFRLALRSADSNLCEESQKYSGSTNNNQPRDLSSTSQIITSSASAAGSPLETVINGVKSVFRYCPAGTFMMGSPSTEEGRRDDEVQHEVRLTMGYWLMETPVTQALWKAVMGRNPSYFEGDDLPVESVNWEYCSKFVRILNDSGYVPKGMKFDFPTEAEWEYACRAGSTTRYSFGDEINVSNANYGGNIGKTTPVKKYQPNAWNLYDMHGNVFEWVYDWYGYYPSGSVTDPMGPTSGLRSVLRGGSWVLNAEYCRSAYRLYHDPSDRYYHYGFRLALRWAE